MNASNHHNRVLGLTACIHTPILVSIIRAEFWKRFYSLKTEEVMMRLLGP